MRVLVVDDHAAVRSEVRSTLQDQGLDVVGEATNGEEAIERAEKLNPDLVIMDVSMPVLDGLNAAKIIKRSHPQTQILMFSGHSIRDFIETAQRLGLNGYALKNEGSSLRDAVDKILRNQTYFPVLGQEDQ